MVLFFALVLFNALACNRPSEAQPNIILIMSDDMGYSDIGCYGSEIHTPTLDELAANGVRYTQFYNTARCCPTRACLLTGLYPHQTGVGHMMNDRGTPAYRGDLNRTSVTIAEVLKPAGYSTYMVGKWHVTPAAKRYETTNWPLQRGFDRFFGTIHGAGSFYDPNTLVSGNDYIAPGDNFYYTNAISDTAVKFIEQHKPDQPFFMYVAYTAAHWPMHALSDDIAKYDGVYDDGWDKLREKRYKRMLEMGLITPDWPMSPPDAKPNAWRFDDDPEWHARCMEVYAAMIDCMDQGIGRIVAKLREKAQLDNTLIFFLQDNGACAEQYGMWKEPLTDAELNVRQPKQPDELQWDMVPKFTRDGRPVCLGRVLPGPADTYIGYAAGWANASNTPFRMYKHWVHEGGISTPLIVFWPKGISARNELRGQPGHLIDIMATCVDVAGAQYPATCAGNNITAMEGVSLVPSFANLELEREAPLYWEHEGNRAVRLGAWKLVSRAHERPQHWTGIDVLAMENWELYDLEQDRTELHDLAAQYPDRVAEMAALWQSWAERVGAVPKPPR
ncbi:arylsulfatase [candidate division KSB1 bacterium]|nr:arylsulfatase [candidate division KSB1 bacterium]